MTNNASSCTTSVNSDQMVRALCNPAWPSSSSPTCGLIPSEAGERACPHSTPVQKIRCDHSKKDRRLQWKLCSQPTRQPCTVDQGDILLPSSRCDLGLCQFSLRAVKDHISLTGLRRERERERICFLWLPCYMLQFIFSCSGESDLLSSVGRKKKKKKDGRKCYLFYPSLLRCVSADVKHTPARNTKLETVANQMHFIKEFTV